MLYSAADYYQINPNGYGISPLQNTANRAQNGLQGGNAYAVGNPFGNIPVVWPNLNQDKYPIFNNGIGAPSTPAIFIDPHNRPGRIFTWSIALQREVTRGLVVEVPNVGNRGAYFPAPNMDQIAQNTVTPASLKSQWGLDITNPTDAALLTTPVSSAAVQSRFPNFALTSVNGTLTVPSVYKGFPASQNLIQAIRGVPQWGALGPWIGPPLGKTWYDSLQAKVTKRVFPWLPGFQQLHLGQGLGYRIRFGQHLLPGRSSHHHGHLQLWDQQTIEPVRETVGDDDHLHLSDAEVHRVFVWYEGRFAIGA